MNISLRIAGSLFAAALLSGCSGDDGLAIEPVSGTVTVDGQPAGHVHLRFQPRADAADVPASEAYADENGRYVLRVTTGAARDGALVGEHEVTISGAESIASRMEWQESTGSTDSDDAVPEIIPPR